MKHSNNLTGLCQFNIASFGATYLEHPMEVSPVSSVADQTSGRSVVKIYGVGR